MIIDVAIMLKNRPELISDIKLIENASEEFSSANKDLYVWVDVRVKIEGGKGENDVKGSSGRMLSESDCRGSAENAKSLIRGWLGFAAG